MLQSWELTSPYAQHFLNNPAFKNGNGGDETARSMMADSITGHGTDAEGADERHGDRFVSEASARSSQARLRV